MITIQQRDAVVNFLVLQNTSRVCLTESTLSECSVSFDELKMILEQLETMQLLTIKHITKDPCVIIAVNAGLSQFYERGGFKTQELILATNLEKLDTELQLLKKELSGDQLKKASNIFSIFNSVLSMIPYIKSIIV